MENFIHAHNVLWSFLLFPLPSLISPDTESFLPKVSLLLSCLFWDDFLMKCFCHLFFFQPTALITIACLSLDGALFTDMDSLRMATPLKKMTPPSCSINCQQLLWEGRWLMILSHDYLSQWWWDVGRSSSMQILHRYPQQLWVHKNSLYVKSRRQHLMTILSTLQFSHSSLSSVMLPECWGRGWHRCPIEDWALNGHLSSALWSTTSLCINCCPLQRPRLRATTIYGYKHKHLEGSLTTWSYSKTKLVDSPLGPMNSPAMGFWSGLQYYIHTVQIQADNSCLTPITVMPLLGLLTHN